ncbi:hypothetical protein DYB25_001075 [Aphanomyces astaci]|uniref:Amino acid transporter transmembrane domain-containing protein n=3 Tax=Aphanomyces astaci TaxID=112090 RepID=A0A397B7Y0_APHAT|nr:hypothetical protein DYB25_001075 [Aphanomyces astaci]
MIYLSVAESDAFSETFAKLKATLSSSSSEEVPPPAPSVGCMVMELRTHPAVHRAVESEIKREGVAVVGQLRREHKLRRALAEERLAYIRMRREHVHLHAEEIQLTVDEDVRAMDHHVATVQAMATRRLQVLLFECLGEIQKAIARAQQRVETQESSVATCELNYAWAIFAKRCEEHFSVASLVDIPPKMLTPSATYVENPSFVAWTTALAPYLSAQLDLPLASATLASPELTITRILAELLNQQLRTTLVSFLEKMVTEGSNRALLAHFSAWNPDTCSSLNASQDDDAMPLEIIAEKDMLEAIWQVERAATDEVKTLVALGVYPTAELGLLRQKQDPVSSMSAHEDAATKSTDVTSRTRPPLHQNRFSFTRSPVPSNHGQPTTDINANNPFVALTPWSEVSTYEVCKMVLMCIFLVPVLRMALCVLLFVPIVVLATISTAGHRPFNEHGAPVPLARWRRVVGVPIKWLIRCVLFVLGYYYIPVTKPAQASQVKPRVIVANHSTYIDGIFLAAYTHGRLKSYEDLAMYCFGKRAELFVEVCILVFSFGIAVAYLVTLGDLITPLGLLFFGPDSLGSSRPFLMSIFCGAIMLPLSLLKDVSSLQFSSMLGVFSIVFLVVAVAIRSGMRIHEDGLPTSLDWGMNLSHGPNFMLSVPIVMFAFTNQVVNCAAYASLWIYLTIGLVAYVAFGAVLAEPHVKGNILLSFPMSDVLIALARAAITFTVAVAYPLNIFPCRFSIDMMFFAQAKESLVRHVVVSTGTNDDDEV